MFPEGELCKSRLTAAATTWDECETNIDSNKASSLIMEPQVMQIIEGKYCKKSVIVDCYIGKLMAHHVIYRLKQNWILAQTAMCGALNYSINGPQYMNM